MPERKQFIGCMDFVCPERLSVEKDALAAKSQRKAFGYCLSMRRAVGFRKLVSAGLYIFGACPLF